MAKSSIHDTHLSDESIAHLAYLLWEKEGRPVGRDVEFWLLAENQLRIHPPLTGTTSPVTSAAEKSPAPSPRRLRPALAPSAGNGAKRAPVRKKAASI